jgi:hypothetical protein
MAEFTRPASDPAASEAKVGDTDSSVSRADPIGTGSEAQGFLSDTEGGDVQANPTFDPLKPREAELQQFPSLYGQPKVEVAARTSDESSKSTSKHRKVFIVDHYGYDFDGSTFDHGPNFNATRQYMLDHGLRPTGDVTLVDTFDLTDRAIALTYEVEAIPAAVATEPETAHMVVSQD